MGKTTKGMSNILCLKNTTLRKRDGGKENYVHRYLIGAERGGLYVKRGKVHQAEINKTRGTKTALTC